MIAGESQVFEMRLSPLGNRQAVAVVRNIREQKRTNEGCAPAKRITDARRRGSAIDLGVDAEGVFTYPAQKVRSS